MSHLTRRGLLAGLGPLALLGTPGSQASASGSTAAPHLFNPLRFGAAGDGKQLDSPAINAAITACTQSGGGMVYVPPGTYRCGTVVLQSHVTLYLEAGATLLGSADLHDYTAFPGDHIANTDTGWRHLIYARDAHDIALTGPGRLDGQGAAFWKPSGIPPLPPEEAWADVIARGIAAKGERPSPLLEFVGCRGVRIQDIRIENASSWTLRPINCQDVQIRGITLRNPVEGHNTDGLDITGCQNVLISDCVIETGDDCICLKSENPYGQQPQLTRNIVVTNCILTTCSNALKIGTATEGGFENISISNCVVYNDEVDYKYRVVSGIALEVVDGGWVDGVTISNIQMQRTRTPIFLRLGDRRRPYPTPRNGLRNVMISDVYATGSVLASSITGLPGRYVQDVSLSHVTVENSFPNRPEWLDRPVPEKPDSYPEARMYGMLPCSGLFARHVRGLELRNLSFRATPGEARPTLLCQDVHNADLSGIRSSPVAGPRPVIQLADVTDTCVSLCHLPADPAKGVVVEGSRETVAIAGNLRPGMRESQP